jgi:plastocyanin
MATKARNNETNEPRKHESTKPNLVGFRVFVISWPVCFVLSCLAVMLAGGAALPRIAAARNGSIRGRVELRHLASIPERRPSVADLGAPSAADVQNRMQSVVYLETAPRGAFEPEPAQHAVMDQRNETFVPHLLAVMTGTTVDFPNSDRFYHNVFSLSKTKTFDLGRYAVGNTKSVRFDRPGIVRVFCDIHSHMNAFILVFSHPFFTVTDEEGRYHIENVPPGSYNAIAWNEGVSSEPKPLTVPDGGTTELDFALR